MSHIVNIATTSDENYARGLIMMIASFIRSNKSLNADEVVFYILDGGLSEKTQSDINNFSHLDGLNWTLKFNFIPADVSLFEEVPKLWGKSNLTLARLFLGDLIAGDYAYWIDSDIIVNTTLPDYNLLQGKTIGACVEPYLPELKLDFPNVQYPFGTTPIDKPYVNAGFMLINLKRWRDLKFSEIAIKAITENPKSFTWLDQSAINFFLAEEITIIDPKYNRNMYSGELNKEVSYNFIDSNIHLTGRVKPWLINEEPKEYFVQNEIFLRMEEHLIGRVNREYLKLITLKFIPPFKVYMYYFTNYKLYKKRKPTLKHGKSYAKIRARVIESIKDYTL